MPSSNSQLQGAGRGPRAVHTAAVCIPWNCGVVVYIQHASATKFHLAYFYQHGTLELQTAWEFIKCIQKVHISDQKGKKRIEYLFRNKDVQTKLYIKQ